MDRIYDWRDLGLQGMDIVLCAGNSKMSRRIQTFQRLTTIGEECGEEWKLTHVAGVYQRVEGDWDHVQESTTINKWAGKKGVQMNPMASWLPNYDGEVYVRKLDFHRGTGFIDRDFNFWMEHKGDDYENGIPGVLELFLCGLRLHRFVRKIFPSYTPKFTKEPHCTELQAKRMLEHDLWDGLMAINRMPPWMWASAIDNCLKVPISKPIRIK